MASEKWSQFFNFSSIDKNRVNGLCKLCHKNYKDRNGTYKTNGVIDDRATADTASIKNRQNEFVLSITKNLIIKCGLPLNFVEHISFREFLKDCHFKFEPVSAKKLKNAVIPALKDDFLQKIHEIINDANDLTLTIDVWSDRRCRSYLRATCHFIDNKMIPQAFLIDFARFKSPHTGENILHLTEDILYDLISEKKFLKSLQIMHPQWSRLTNLAYLLTIKIVFWNIKQIQYPMKTQHSTVYDIQLDNFEIINVQYPDDVEDYQGLPKYRLSCFLHSLQLCVRDGVHNASHISKVLEKCRTLSKVSHKSNKIADLFDQMNKILAKQTLQDGIVNIC
ncbi:unnamed protein product [Rotaria socialis]|uniref:Uncharacterized protein n=1 Tax=Rotaria socialis TaxID=392032 RepID=A0A821NR65_9BILA|nr:unnamed protein product [Rotaria socialis]CAF4789964.1 unnamed protein product [Rotaria socialis]